MTLFSCSHNWFNALHVDVFYVSLHRFVIVTIFFYHYMSSLGPSLFSSVLHFNYREPALLPMHLSLWALHSVRRIEHFASSEST